MADVQPFVFRTERRLVGLTGSKASTIAGLVGMLRELPGSVIFYHTHHMYLSHHFERPQFTNDFALWVSEAMQDEMLAEKLASVDLLSYTTIRALRETLIAVIENHLRRPGSRERLASRVCPAGHDFHFCRSMSFVMTTGLVAHDAPELFALLTHASNVSLFFHFFEARLRLGRQTNDFSQWLASNGHTALASRIDRLNPYDYTLDEFRDRLISLGESYLR